MDNLLLHTFNGLTSVRSYKEDNGIDWFHGGDVCKILGFSNPTVIIQMHTDEDERKKIDIGTLNDTWFVSEPGLWGLILVSKSKQAKDFKRWLKHSLLPKLRATGVVMTSNATPVAVAKEWEAQGKELEELRAELTRLQEENFEQNKTIIHLSRERQKVALADLECAIADKDPDRINTLRALSSLPPLSRSQSKAVKMGTYRM